MRNLQKWFNNDMKWFWHKSYFNCHLGLYQDFREFSIRMVISYSSLDEYNWIIGGDLFFWKIEYSWNGRKIGKDQQRLIDIIKNKK